MSDETINRDTSSREIILQAAHSLFIEHGYHGTSMRQIAHKAGVALGGIYNHFPSKESIFENIVLERHPFSEVLPAMLAAQGDCVEAWARDAASRMVAAMDERLDFLNLMFIELVEFKGKHLPALVERFMPEVMGFGQRFLKEQDRLRPIPVPILLRTFIGLFFSYVLTELMVAPNMPPQFSQNSLDFMVDIFLHGILENPGQNIQSPD